MTKKNLAGACENASTKTVCKRKPLAQACTHTKKKKNEVIRWRRKSWEKPDSNVNSNSLSLFLLLSHAKELLYGALLWVKTKKKKRRKGGASKRDREKNTARKKYKRTGSNLLLYIEKNCVSTCLHHDVSNSVGNEKKKEENEKHTSMHTSACALT